MLGYVCWVSRRQLNEKKVVVPVLHLRGVRVRVLAQRSHSPMSDARINVHHLYIRGHAHGTPVRPSEPDHV